MAWVAYTGGLACEQWVCCIIDLETQGAIKSIITAAIASHVVVRQANVLTNNMLPEEKEISGSVADP